MSNSQTRYNLGLFNSGSYTPFLCDITAIVMGQTTLVTTSTSHGFVIGNEVQFFIPEQWGMIQLDERTGYISAIPASNQFVVNINTLGFNPFVTPSPPTYVVLNPAQVSGIGDSNTGTSSPGGIPNNPNTVPGAFQNQPP